MRSSRQVYEEIREEMRVGLTAEFHENFRRKAFFDQPWKPRKESGWKSSRRKSPRSTLLVATGKLRRSLKAQKTASGCYLPRRCPTPRCTMKASRAR